MLDISCDLSLRKQSALLDLNRSSFYYKPKVSDLDLKLMNQIDMIFMDYPFYGSRRMTATLNDEGFSINRKRIQKLMRIMGIEAIYPKPKTTTYDKEHKIYPYLLRNIDITKPNQVWAGDITYIGMPKGFMYLMAIIDWYSRYILSWKLSNSLETFFCLEALEDALNITKPEIFNTDQGCQFTSESWTNSLTDNDIKISMDGKGRAIDNIIIERFFRSIKYEEVYINPADDVKTLKSGIKNYINFYNHKRLHQSLNYKTPAQIYLS